MDVCAADTFGNEYVVLFGYQGFGVVAFVLEDLDDLSCKVAGVGVFEEGDVWEAFAGSVVAVGGV